MPVAHPWWDQRWIANVAWNTALIPLAWLLVRAWRGKSIDAAWWWLAAAFGVSWLADAPIDFIPHSADWLPNFLYLVSQTAIIGAVLLPRREQAVSLLAFLVAVGILAAVSFGADKPDAVLHSVAWTSVVLIVLMRPDLPALLRLSLVLGFGVRLLTWLIRVRWPIVATWYPDQLVRLASLLVFCWAATEPTSQLRLVRDD